MIGCIFIKNKNPVPIKVRGVGIDLSSRAASSQVFWAQTSLTSVFGMGTGGPSLLKTPTMYDVCTPYSLFIAFRNFGTD